MNCANNILRCASSGCDPSVRPLRRGSIQRDGGREAEPGGGRDRDTRAVLSLPLHIYHHYAYGEWLVETTKMRMR